MQIEQIKHIIKNRKMNRFQILAVFVCILISMIDGYDVMTIAFVVPSLAELWLLSPEKIGILFSAGLIGMVSGAIIITPFADKYGRRAIIIVCLLLLSTSTIASGFCLNHTQLIVARFISGLAIGAIMPSINTIIAEFSSDQSRSLAIGIMAASYTTGSVIGGILCITLISHLGWQYVFFLGGAFSCFLLPLVFWLLPESLEFILLNRRYQSLAKLNYLLTKLSLPTFATFPQLTYQSSKEQKQVNLIMTANFFKTTLLMTVSVSTMMISFYFLINWTPKILVYLGYTKEMSVTASLVMNIFGIIGGLSIGWLSKKYSVQKITSLMAFIAFLLVMGFGLSTDLLPIVFFLIAMIGYTTFGAMAGVYAIIPAIYPSTIRATGTGFVFGFSRLIGTLGPYLAGLLIAAHLSESYCIFIMSLPLLASSICMIFVKPFLEQLD